METNYKTLRIIVIVTVSTLVTILTPVESKCVALSDSFAAGSLLSDCPPSESESPSPSPAPGPEVMKPANPPAEIDSDLPSASPANPPADIDTDSPVSSPEATADSSSPANSPTEIDTETPAPSPEATTDSISPANPPTETGIESPASSPEAPADSTSTTNAPTEIDTESPAPSPESPADYSTEVDYDSPAASPESPTVSIFPTNPPSQETPSPSSGSKLLKSPKNLLNQTLLSPEIKTICSKTDNPSLCESSVTPLLTAHLKPDASSVFVLAIQASIDATKAAMAVVEKVSADECQELYDDAVTNLEDAIQAVKSRDIPTVNTNLSAAMTDYGTCNDGFEESGDPNPLGDVSVKLTKMVSNCLAISTLIK